LISIGHYHRNLRSRTSTYVGTGLANIFGERTPCKKMADLPLDKAIGFKGKK
jgi:hypothetical protein